MRQIFTITVDMDDKKDGLVAVELACDSHPNLAALVAATQHMMSAVLFESKVDADQTFKLLADGAKALQPDLGPIQ
jgi:hypothetical protein